MLCFNFGMGCGLPVARRHLRIGVPEALSGSYVGVVWPLASGPASGPSREIKVPWSNHMHFS